MVQLPYEIWADIVDLMSPDDSHCWALKRKDLRYLCSTNLTLNRVATPLLYRWCEANMLASAKTLRKALLSNPLAINSVRHLKIRASISCQSLRTMPLAWAEALEGMPNLVSLAMEPILETSANCSAYLSMAESCDFASVVFANPQRFPFRIQLFSTNLACTPSLNEFISSQSSITSIHWVNPRIAEDHEPEFSSGVVAQAFTKFPTCAALVTYVPIFLAKAPGVRRVLIDTQMTDPEWAVDFGMGALHDTPALGKLEKLTVLADPSETIFLEAFLDVVTPLLHSLSVLEFSCEGSPSYVYPKIVARTCRQLFNIQTFIFNAACFYKHIRRWSEALYSLPHGLELYAIYECGGWAMAEWEYICFRQDAKGSWDYDILPLRASYPTKAGTQHNWHITPNPEKLISITSLVNWN